MKRTHQGNGSGCRWAAKHAGAWAAGIAVVCTVVSPNAAQGQSAVWQPPGATSGNISYNGGNVGVGTSTPASLLHVKGGASTNALIGPPDSSGALELIANDGSPWGYANITENATNATGPWTLRNSSREGWSIGFTSTTGWGGGIGFVRFAPGTAAPSTLLNIRSDGNVGIGTVSPPYKLAVEGTIGARDIIVTSTPWPDYVFQPGYRLRPLNEVHQFIQANGHLPEIPSEKEVKDKGVSVGEMQAKLLAKVEELMLHLIQQEKDKDELRARLADLERRIAAGGNVSPGR